MRTQILPFSEEWRAGIEALGCEVFPEYVDASLLWRPGHQLDEPDNAKLRLVALNADRSVVGYGAIRQTAPQRYRLNLLVQPSSQGEGIGTALYDRLMAELRSSGAVAVNVRTRDDQTLALDFLYQRGFEEVHRMKGMTLRVDRLDPDRLEPLLLPLDQENVATDLLGDLRRTDPDWREKLYVLYSRVREGWPDFDPTLPEEKVWPLEHFDRYLSQRMDAGPTWIAQYGDSYIGFVGAFGTAVHPDWRGRGLGGALKALQAVKAHAEGQPTLISNSANPMIWRINRRIGYQPWFAEVRLIKGLS
jgi:GNAT superfamily N-acetyltransferase